MSAERARALKYAIAAAIIAFIIALEPLCAQTYSLIFADKAPLAFSNALGRTSPIPKALVWSDFTQSLVFRLGTLPAGLTLTLHLLLWMTLVYCLLRVLNRTFRLTSGVDWDKGVLTHTYMHTPPLIKVFLIAVAAAVPAIALNWLLQTVIRPADLSIAIRLVLGGAAIWLLFSGAGVAGDCEMGNYELPRERRVLIILLLQGGAAGLLAFAILKTSRFMDPFRYFDFFTSMGGMGEAQWRIIVAVSCLGGALLGFGMALAVAALSRDGNRLIPDAKGLAAGAGMVLLTGLAIGWWLPRHVRDRYDYSEKLGAVLPSGMTVASDSLQRKCALPRPPLPQTILLMLPSNGPQVLSVVRGSVALLDISPQSAKQIEAFLKKRDYLTSLSDAAFKTLHDAASLQWDTEESLRVDYLKLAKCPDAQFMAIFVDRLRTCASTPATLHYADLLADEKVFSFPTRDSEVLMGDIYARLGERKKAEAWYRRAEVPAGRMGEILSDRTMFSTGVVSGKLTLNGKPAAGYRVGLFPAPVAGDVYRSMILPGIFRPYWLRWIGPKTVTGADGAFKIEHIVAANYCVAIAGPDLKMRPFSRRLDVKNPPGEIFIGFGRPTLDLGEIALTVRPPRMMAPPSGPPAAAAQPPPA